MRKIITLTVAFASVLALSACTFQDYEGPGSSTVVGVENNNGFTHFDMMFVESMIEHHKGAVEMSQLALTNTTNPKVLEIANSIIKNQTGEITMLESWVSGNKDVSDDGMQMTSMGMMSDEDLGKLKNAHEAEFDKLYLLGMIVHHQGAVEMAQEVKDSHNSKVSDFAKQVIVDQTAEIAKMRNLI